MMPCTVQNLAVLAVCFGKRTIGARTQHTHTHAQIYKHQTNLFHTPNLHPPTDCTRHVRDKNDRDASASGGIAVGGSPAQNQRAK